MIKHRAFSTLIMMTFVFSLLPQGWAESPEATESLLETADSAPAIKNLVWADHESRKKGSRSEIIYIVKGTSQVFRFDRPVKRISVSSPQIIDIIPVSLNEIVVHAKEPGRINLIAWDVQNRAATYDVQSVIDIDRLSQILKKIDPAANLTVIPFEDNVAVFGSSDTSGQVEQIEQASLAFDEAVVNFVEVRDPKQILLEVRFAEIDRTAGRDFGLDGSINKRWSLFELFNGQNAPDTSSTVAAILTEGAKVAVEPFTRANQNTANAAYHYFSDSVSIQAFMEYLITKNVLKLIARPNLLAKDGEEARFVVGGEIPYITSNNNSTNVEYKEFGTQLTFTPTVLEDGVIRIEADTQISELDFTNTVSLQGTTAPTIIKTEHSTVAELRAGQSLVIGGLLTQRISKADRKVPILGDIPIIQKLFRREGYSRKDVEIMLVITPHIVDPYDEGAYRRPVPFPGAGVEKAMQAYHPPFPDEAADTISLMLTQAEPRPHFEQEEMKRADKIVGEAFNELSEIRRLAVFSGVKSMTPDLVKRSKKANEKNFIEVVYEDTQDAPTAYKAPPHRMPEAITTSWDAMLPVSAYGTEAISLPAPEDTSVTEALLADLHSLDDDLMIEGHVTA